MRLAGQAKLGYFPAASEALALLLKHLHAKPFDTNRPKFTLNIIDPCAGEGLALKQIREGLGVDPLNTYAVELDKGRADKVRENNPGINVVGPASFINTQITGFSFGLAYVNPPFDDELGGGRREEYTFAREATRLLPHKGILVLVMPFRALCGNHGFVTYLDAMYDQAALYKFPDGLKKDGKPIRNYNEIVFIGRKRLDALSEEAAIQHGKLYNMDMAWQGYVEITSLPSLGSVQPRSWYNGKPSMEKEEGIRVWEVPTAWRPYTFKKTMFTDDELNEAIAASPLNKLLEEVKEVPPPSPPMPLGHGHLGLILASGMLDGVVEGPHGNHVVRGSSKKVEFVNEPLCEVTENPETGAVTEKTVISQRMVTVIRTVEPNGNMQTFSNEVIDAKDEEAA